MVRETGEIKIKSRFAQIQMLRMVIVLREQKKKGGEVFWSKLRRFQESYRNEVIEVTRQAVVIG